MSIITIDFETYYAKDFSLSKLTTEEYIRDKQFEVIGVAVKSGKARYLSCGVGAIILLGVFAGARHPCFNQAR